QAMMVKDWSSVEVIFEVPSPACQRNQAGDSVGPIKVIGCPRSNSLWIAWSGRSGSWGHKKMIATAAAAANKPTRTTARGCVLVKRQNLLKSGVIIEYPKREGTANL